MGENHQLQSIQMIIYIWFGFYYKHTKNRPYLIKSPDSSSKNSTPIYIHLIIIWIIIATIFIIIKIGVWVFQSKQKIMNSKIIVDFSKINFCN